MEKYLADMLHLMVAIASAVATGFAALAAWRSSETAKEMRAFAETTERQRAADELLALHSEIQSMGKVLGVIQGFLRQEIKSSAIFANGFGGGRYKIAVEDVDKDAEEVAEIIAAAERIMNPETGRGKIKDLPKARAKMRALLASLRGMQEAQSLKLARCEVERADLQKLARESDRAVAELSSAVLQQQTNPQSDRTQNF